VYLVAHDSSLELVPTKFWHIDNEKRFEKFRRVTEATSFKPGIGLPGRVLVSGSPEWIVDVKTDKNFPRAKLVTDIGVQAAFGFPVLVRDEVVAVLEFFSDTAREPDMKLLCLMGHVGTVLGRVFERNQFRLSILESNMKLKQLLLENEQLCEDLKSQKIQLEMANRHQSQFLANMSHELRTPLNAILGYTELILNNIYGDVPEKIRWALLRMEPCGRHLLNLVNDVLDLTKIEAGQLQLSIQEYSIEEIVESVMSAMTPLASKKGLALISTVPSNLPQAKGDQGRINQVLLNLVGNAIKFTESGKVKVQVAHINDHFRFTISDTGSGIAPAHLKKLFKEFYQVDASSTRQAGGAGLGLAIVERIVKLHGGTVGIESELGKGSSFWFTIPTHLEPRKTL
jgi:signal transduction histidine kinase